LLIVTFDEQNRDTGWDLNVVSLDDDRTPRPVVHSRFQERMGSLSPDGRYLAYVSDDTSRREIYVVPFPDLSEKWTISTAGGTAPRWRRNGQELFFIDPGGRLMSVSVTRGRTIAFGLPTPLFDLQAVSNDGWTYAVSADGQRILAARPTDAPPTPITVVVNWTDLLNQ
jgi:dipeptidyl aminopeptidase/acylaminoacyl peptidase